MRCQLGFNKDSLAKATTKSVISLELGKYGQSACTAHGCWHKHLALFWSEQSACPAFIVMGKNTSLKESKSITWYFKLLIVDKVWQFKIAKLPVVTYKCD